MVTMQEAQQINDIICLEKELTMKNSIRFQGPKMWNSFENNMKSTSFRKFKENLKQETIINVISFFLFHSLITFHFRIFV